MPVVVLCEKNYFADGNFSKFSYLDGKFPEKPIAVPSNNDTEINNGRGCSLQFIQLATQSRRPDGFIMSKVFRVPASPGPLTDPIPL